MRGTARATGFTIIELMIATAVFSTILLLCATGLITIGRLYQKGNSSRAAQEVARSVMDQIKSDFELSGGGYKSIMGGFCIGDNLYSYGLNKKTDLSAGKHALVISQPDGGCATNGSVTAENLDSTSAKELLGQNMRLSVLSIQPVTSDARGNPLTIHIRLGVVYGDDDLLTDDGQGCKSDAGQEYCAGSVLDSYATRRLQ